jgi:hypothetical protein
LTLTASTIAANTTVLVPAVSGFGLPGHFTAINQATIFAANAENDGTIETAGSPLTRGGTLHVVLHTYGPYYGPPLNNEGTITASYGSTIALTGYDGLSGSTFPYDVGRPGATLDNNGVINDYGTITDNSVSLEDTGTVNLGLTPGYLGLSSSPGRFEFTGENGSQISASQNFVFHGGQLLLGPGYPLENGQGFEDTDQLLRNFQGTLSNFGMDSTDLIELKGFAFTSSSYANGVLSLDGGLMTLHFANLPALGQFVFTTSGGNTDITWHPFLLPHGL